MPTARIDFGISAVNGKIYVIGGAQGWQQPGLSIVEEYDTGFGTSVENNAANVPPSFELQQNYPNPFNPITTIEFDLPKSSDVTLKVYNILGEEVATLVSDKLYAGSYLYEWDASKLASGVYLYRLRAGEYTIDILKYFKAASQY